MLSFTVRPIAGASALCIALAGALTLMMTTPTAMAASLQDDDHVDLPGMGLSELDPEGTPFVLPEGLTIEDPIGGYNTSDPEDCDYKYADQAVGKGEQVRLCLVFNNATDSPITLQFPPGLIFVSRSRKVQNGMIAQRISIEVPAATRYFKPLFSYCVNGSRDSASLGDEFDVGVVTDDAALRALFEFLADKVVTDTNFVAVNVAIGSIVDEGSINEYALAELEAAFGSRPSMP